MKKQTIVQGHKENFETLKRVFADGVAGLVQCKIKATGEDVAVVAAIVEDGGVYRIMPFAMFFNGNPYELLIDPSSAADADEKEEKK